MPREIVNETILPECVGCGYFKKGYQNNIPSYDLCARNGLRADISSKDCSNWVASALLEVSVDTNYEEDSQLETEE